LPKDSNILSDRNRHLAGRLANSRKHPLHCSVREIRVVIDTGKVLRSVTNDLDAPVQELQYIYKQRWQIRTVLSMGPSNPRSQALLASPKMLCAFRFRGRGIDRLSPLALGPGGSKRRS